MNNITVGLDVDGVLANFILSACNLYGRREELIETWELDWIEDFEVIFNDVNFWDGLIVLNHPRNITFKFDYYITSIPQHLRESRTNWLRKHGFPDKPVIVSNDKLKTCEELGVDVLIDDKPETMAEVKNSDIVTGIQYVPYYFNPPITGDYHTDDLNDVNGLIKQMINKNKL